MRKLYEAQAGKTIKKRREGLVLCLHEKRTEPENKRVFLRELQKGEGRIGKTGVWKCKQEDSQALKAEIKTNQEKIQRLVEILSMAEKGTEKYFLEQIDAISRKNEELKGRITEKKEDGKQDEPDINSLAEKLLCFGNVIKEMTVEQKRDAVRMLLEEVKIRQESEAVRRG